MRCQLMQLQEHTQQRNCWFPDMHTCRVGDTMTPLNSCFMLELHTKLDFDVMTSLYLSVSCPETGRHRSYACCHA